MRIRYNNPQKQGKNDRYWQKSRFFAFQINYFEGFLISGGVPILTFKALNPS